nr:hypothetical protein [Haloquadratum walsbyi]
MGSPRRRRNCGTSPDTTLHPLGRRRGIPDDSELKSELNEHDRYSGLYSQSTQRLLEKLAESVSS